MSVLCLGSVFINVYFACVPALTSGIKIQKRPNKTEQCKRRWNCVKSRLALAAMMENRDNKIDERT